MSGGEYTDGSAPLRGMLPPPMHAQPADASAALPPPLTAEAAPRHDAPLGAFSRRPRAYQMARLERLPVVALFLVCMGLLLVAAWLPPASAGFGTHQQLGLAPCGFKAATGLPCATCGMTTAFSHMTHAQPLASFYVQPAGAVLAIFTALIAVVTGFALVTGMPLGPVASRVFRPMPLISFGVFFLASWGYAIWLHTCVLPA